MEWDMVMPTRLSPIRFATDDMGVSRDTDRLTGLRFASEERPERTMPGPLSCFGFTLHNLTV